MDQDQEKKKLKGKSRWGDSSNALEHIIPCLEGFAIAKKSSSLLQKRFDPPELPKGFQPKGIKGKKSRFEPGQDDQLRNTNLEREVALATFAVRSGIRHSPRCSTGCDGWPRPFRESRKSHRGSHSMPVRGNQRR